MAVYVLTIAGSTKVLQHLSLDIKETANGRNLLNCDILSVDGSYRPALGAEVILTEDGTRIFGGNIDAPSEAGFGGTGAAAAIVTRISATDFNALASRKEVTEEIPAGTLEDALVILTTYLADYGVTLHASQATGPTLPALSYAGRKLDAVLDELSALTEYAWTWDIDYSKVLRMVEIGTVAAPFDVTDSNGFVDGDITVTPSTTDYANFIILLAGSGQREMTDLYTGDGVTTVFALNYPLVSWRGYVTNGPDNETLGLAGEGAVWTYDPVTNTITRTSAPANLNAIEIIYTAQFPVRVTADGGAAPADLVEKTYTNEAIFDVTVAQALVDALLVRDMATPKNVRYPTREVGIHPGQVQTITSTKRNLSGSFLVTDVQISNPAGNLLMRQVTLVSGGTIPASWRDTIKSWSNSSSASSASAVVTIITSGGVGGAGTPGMLPLWSTPTILADSLIAQSGSTITVTGALSVLGALHVAAIAPTYEFFETDASADNKYWRWYIDAEVFNLQTVNDAHSSTSTLLAFTRAGIANFGGGRVGILGVSPTLDFYESDQGADLKYSRWIVGNQQILLQSVNDAYSSATTLLLIERATGDLSVLGTVTAPLFSGSGASLTTLNASNLASGDVPAARIAARSLADLGTRSAGDLSSGTLLAARLPALTGDVTSSVGTVATTLSAGSASVLNSGNLAYARMPNGSGTWTAVPTISGAVTLQSTLSVSGAASFPGDIGSSLIPTLTDTYDIGRYDRLWNQGYLSQLNAIVFALNTQTLFGGYSTIGKNAGSFAAAVASGSTTIDFGQNLTENDFVLVRATDTGGAVTAEYIQVLTNVTGTTYNVTRNLSGGGAKNWASGVPYLVLGTTGDGRIDLFAYDGKPRMVLTTQGATYNAQSNKGLIGNLNTYFGYVTDIYGVAFGDPLNAWIKIDATNGIRIGHNTTTKISLDASGNASFSGSITATSGTIGGWTIDSSTIYSGTGSNQVGLYTGGTVRIYAGSSAAASAPFRVTETGALTATDAVITGRVFADTSTYGATNPAFSFNTDQDTGMYSQSANTVSFAGNGVAVINFLMDANNSSIGIINKDLGTNKGPSISLARNTNATTPGSGVLSIENRGGTFYHLWVDANGKFRLGTTVPNSANDTSGTEVGSALSGTLSVNGVATLGNGLIMSGGDIIPTTDNTVSVGLAANRFTLVRAVTITPGDVHFDNGWSLTEHDRIGVNQPGLALLDDTGTLVAFFGKTQTYSKPWADIDDLPHHLTTATQRSKMDSAPTTRIVGYRRDATQSPIYGTVAEIAFPNPGTAQSTRQRGGG